MKKKSTGGSRILKNKPSKKDKGSSLLEDEFDAVADEQGWSEEEIVAYKKTHKKKSGLIEEL